MWVWYVQIVRMVSWSRNMEWKQWYLGSKASGLLFGVTGGMDFKSTQQITSTSCQKQAAFAAGNPLSFLKSNSSFGILTSYLRSFSFDIWVVEMIYSLCCSFVYLLVIVRSFPLWHPASQTSKTGADINANSGSVMGMKNSMPIVSLSLLNDSC